MEVLRLLVVSVGRAKGCQIFSLAYLGHGQVFLFVVDVSPSGTNRRFPGVGQINDTSLG